jgi:16S rRNA (adenine1518-N6/adenine1519-N6)-dimethyltransferase
MSNLPTTSELISKYDLRAKKSLGQNFILDKNFTDKIVRSSNHQEAGLLSNALILEIGPGPGSLTRSILDHDIKKLTVVEKDVSLLPLLAEFKDIYDSKIEIINDDALKIDETKIFDQPFKIIANLPYNVATPLIIKWLKIIKQQPRFIQSITIMLQKEVAQRIVAKKDDKEYGRLAVMVNFLCQSKILFNVNASVFSPPPKITSAIVELIPRTEPLCDIAFELMEKVVGTAFLQRRKMIKSPLKEILLKNNHDQNNTAEQILKDLGINPNLRAENLTIEEFGKIAQYLKENHD